MLLLPRVLPHVPLGMVGVQWKTIRRNTVLLLGVPLVLVLGVLLVLSVPRLLGADVPDDPCRLL
jgi:hypothetical protein